MFFNQWDWLPLRLPQPSEMLVSEVFESWMQDREQTGFLSEVVESRNLTHAARQGLSAWTDKSKKCWQSLAGDERGLLIAHMAVDEAAFARPLSEVSRYRLVRRLGIARLFGKAVSDLTLDDHILKEALSGKY